ncbi:hypothetical protein C8R41DRAFT_915479 [Lentinula lateritia]|uniref:Uncharacterized protein n=1 Tax=Lentinula lateritia TaxID=40482 RepID=A0ABQ8VSB5_9AGAR|nr:hypothetical protein C8R41DRAFT_915479 [Lentinula lateritia]
MLLTIFGQPCVAGKDISIYQSVISRSFICAAHSDNWRCDSVAATANFGLDYTLPLEFIVLNDLAGYDAIFGVEFQQRCQYSNSVRIYDNLPFVRSSLETHLPLPVLPLVTGQYSSVLSRSHNSELLSLRPNSSLEARLSLPISPAVTASVFPCSQDSEPLSSTPNFIPQIGFVTNKLVSPPAVTSCVSNFPINDSEQSQRALHVGSSFVSNNKITKNLVSPNGCSHHNGTHPLINRENHTVAFAASTSQRPSVPSILPTSDDVLTACLFVMRLYTD